MARNKFINIFIFFSLFVFSVFLFLIKIQKMDNKDKETTADEEQLSNLKGKFVLMA